MKILLLSPLPPPVGGIASWTQNILGYYEGYEGSNFEIFLLNTAIKGRNITKKDLLSRIFSGICDSIRIIFNLYLMIKKYNPEIIHVNSSGSLGLWKDYLIALLSKFFNVPVVFHFHFGRIPSLYESKNWEWQILQKVVSNCSHIIVLDSESAEILNKYFDITTSIIPNPLSKDIQNKINEKSEFNNSVDKSIIFVGHVTSSKGVYELVQSYLLLDDAENNLKFIGPYEEDVKNDLIHLAGEKADRINFLGIMDKSNVLFEMKRATALVLPSYTEGFPNVIIEAMAMKCPIVATNVGAIASMLNIGSARPAGLVIEPKNVQALTKALEFMLSNPDKAQYFAQNAFLKVKSEYTLEKVCVQYENIWKYCVNREI